MAETLYATLHTNHGPIRVQLFPDHAPATVRNFVELAEGSKDYVDPRTGQQGKGTPYYDGTISHRVIAGFMIQLGDPTGTGRGGPGFKFGDEFHPALQFDLRTCSPWRTPARARTARSSSSPSAPPRT